MKHYEEVIETRRKLMNTTCDICDRDVQWDRKNFSDISETKIYLRTGNTWPEGGSGTTKLIDTCEDCFETKIIPALRKAGIFLREEEWDQ